MSQMKVMTSGIPAAAQQVTSGGGGWEPDDRSGLEVWFDASDATTIHDTAGAVDTWDDKSGNARHATATTTARPTTGTRTINSLNVLDFNGSTNKMQTSSFSTLTFPFTVAAVIANDDGADGTDQRICTEVNNGRYMGKRVTNFWIIYSGNGVNSAGAPDTTAHHMLGLFKTSPNAINAIDGSEVTGNAGAGSWAGGIVIGASNASSAFWDGKIAELVAYSAELNSTDRNTLYAYFEEKWGL